MKEEVVLPAIEYLNKSLGFSIGEDEVMGLSSVSEINALVTQKVSLKNTSGLLEIEIRVFFERWNIIDIKDSDLLKDLFPKAHRNQMLEDLASTLGIKIKKDLIKNNSGFLLVNLVVLVSTFLIFRESQLPLKLGALGVALVAFFVGTFMNKTFKVTTFKEMIELLSKYSQDFKFDHSSVRNRVLELIRKVLKQRKV